MTTRAVAKLLAVVLTAPGLTLVLGGSTGVPPVSAASSTPADPPVAAAVTPAPAHLTGQVRTSGGAGIDDIVVEAFATGSTVPAATALTYAGPVVQHGYYDLRVPAGTYRVRFSSAPTVTTRYDTVFYGGGTGTAQTLTAAQVRALNAVTLTATPAPVVNQSLPLISGTPATGEVLSATAGGWTPTSGLTFSYRWRRGTSDIAQATQPTYSVTAADVGQPLSVRVTATRGTTAVTATSAAVTGRLGAAPVPSGVALSGSAQAGGTLRVGGSWTHSPALAVAWLRDGVQVAGSGSSYTVTAADAGRSLSARVTATAAGRLTGTTTTAGVSVARLPSRVAVDVKDRRIRAGGQVRVAVAVTSVPGAVPSGSVTVLRGTTVVGAATLGPDGRVTIAVTGLKKGQHRLTVSYAGSATTSGSTSSGVTVIVKRRSARVG